MNGNLSGNTWIRGVYTISTIVWLHSICHVILWYRFHSRPLEEDLLYIVRLQTKWPKQFRSQTKSTLQQMKYIISLGEIQKITSYHGPLIGKNPYYNFLLSVILIFTFWFCPFCRFSGYHDMDDEMAFRRYMDKKTQRKKQKEKCHVGYVTGKQNFPR